METMEIRFTLTAKDYQKAMRLNVLRSRRTLVMTIAFLMILVGMRLISPSFQQQSLVLLFLIALATLAIYLYIIRPQLAVMRLRKHRQLNDELNWLITDNEVVITTDNSETKTNWQIFGKIRETDEYFFLVLAGATKMYQIIPKRAFESEEQAQTFKELAEKYIKGQCLKSAE